MHTSSQPTTHPTTTTPPTPHTPTPHTPIHRLTTTALVFTGGTLGTLCRWATTTPHHPTTAAWGLLAANLLGAWLLGIGKGYQATTPPHTQHAARIAHIMAFFGIGFCGAFTSYSALAALITHTTTHPAPTTLYFIATLTGGLACAYLGLRIGNHWARKNNHHQHTQ